MKDEEAMLGMLNSRPQILPNNMALVAISTYGPEKAAKVPNPEDEERE